jgi:hypothetical protein
MQIGRVGQTGLGQELKEGEICYKGYIVKSRGDKFDPIMRSMDR